MGITKTIVENNFSKKIYQLINCPSFWERTVFFYGITDRAQNLVVFKEWKPLKKIADSSGSDALRDFFEHENLLSLPYGNTSIGLHSSKFTLLPSRLYNAQHEKVYLEQLGNLSPNELIKVDVLPFKARLIYTLEQSLDVEIQQLFPTAYTNHILSALIVAFQQHIRLKNEHQVFINVDTKKLQIFVFEDTNLLFVNVFPFQPPKIFSIMFF